MVYVGDAIAVRVAETLLEVRGEAIPSVILINLVPLASGAGESAVPGPLCL